MKFPGPGTSVCLKQPGLLVDLHCTQHCRNPDMMKHGSLRRGIPPAVVLFMLSGTTVASKSRHYCSIDLLATKAHTHTHTATVPVEMLH